MKKALFMFSMLIGTAFLMIGADFRTGVPTASGARAEQHCAGYTVIEAGLGVDCKGDTVKLIKKYGYYELASRYEKETFASRLN